jgi:hypothetical protein
MKMAFKVLALCGAAAAITLSAVAQGPNIEYDRIQIFTQKLAPNFYALTGSPEPNPGHPEAAGGLLPERERKTALDKLHAPLDGLSLSRVRRTCRCSGITAKACNRNSPCSLSPNIVFARNSAFAVRKESAPVPQGRPWACRDGRSHTGAKQAAEKFGTGQETRTSGAEARRILNRLRPD